MKGSVKTKKRQKAVNLVIVPPFLVDMPPVHVESTYQYLCAQGYAVTLTDLNIDFYTKYKFTYDWWVDTTGLSDESLPRFMRDFKEEFNTFIKNTQKYDVIVYFVSKENYRVAEVLAEKIGRKDDQLLIAAYVDFNCFSEFSDTKKIFDVYCEGEAEKSIADILEQFDSGNVTTSTELEVPGIIIPIDKGHTAYRRLPGSNKLRELHQLPICRFDAFKLDCYTAKNHLRIITSRGCVNSCAFCLSCTENAPYRTRPPQDVFDEISYLTKHHGIKTFHFHDLLCNGNLATLRKLCNLLIEDDLNISWFSNAIFRNGMDDGLLTLMKRSGCVRLDFGMESGSDLLNRRVGKYYPVKKCEELLRRIHEKGIGVCLDFIIGLPGENNKEFKKTLRFLRQNRAYVDKIGNISVLYLGKTSAIAKNPEQYGITLYPLYNAEERKYLFSIGNTNTPERRAQRLRQLIALTDALGFELVRINNADEKIPDYLNLVKKKNAFQFSLFHLFQRTLLVRVNTLQKSMHLYDTACNGAYDRKKKLSSLISKFFSLKRLTSFSGFYCSFHDAGDWIDTSDGDWQLLKQSNKETKVKITFEKYGMIQYWTYKIIQNMVFLTISIEFTKTFATSQLSFGIFVPPSFDKFSMGDICYESLPKLTDDYVPIKFFYPEQLDTIIFDSDQSSYYFKIDSDFPYLDLCNETRYHDARTLKCCISEYNIVKKFKKGDTLEHTITLEKVQKQ